MEPHHIVAIGASAGGLDELITFFENTPLDGVKVFSDSPKFLTVSHHNVTRP